MKRKPHVVGLMERDPLLKPEQSQQPPQADVHASSKHLSSSLSTAVLAAGRHCREQAAHSRGTQNNTSKFIFWALWVGRTHLCSCPHKTGHRHVASRFLAGKLGGLALRSGCFTNPIEIHPSLILHRQKGAKGKEAEAYHLGTSCCNSTQNSGYCPEPGSASY